MSKYNLIDIYEGMSDKEFSAAEEAGRLEKHPEKDKIQKIKDLMSKEKSIEEINKEEKLKTAYSALDKAEQDGDIRKQELALAAIDLIKGNLKEDNIEEMTGETFYRIDGLTNQNLKVQFLDKFSEIYEDMLEAGDMFDVSDVIDYLCTEMQAYATDTKMDAGGMMEENDSIKEELAPTGIAISQKQLDNLERLGAISGLEVTVQDKDGSNVRKVNYTLTNTNFEKGDDDYDYLEEGLKEHFGRFMKDYQ